jgi:hypothetical protein
MATEQCFVQGRSNRPHSKRSAILRSNAFSSRFELLSFHTAWAMKRLMHCS